MEDGSRESLKRRLVLVWDYLYTAIEREVDGAGSIGLNCCYKYF